MVGGALKLASNVFNPDTELSDIKSMRRELQSTMTDISSDLKSIDSGIDTLKTIATETYEMVVDLKHKLPSTWPLAYFTRLRLLALVKIGLIAL